MKCLRCLTEIRPGQAYLPHGMFCRYHGDITATFIGPVHLSCPTERERQQLAWKDRARAVLNGHD